MEEWLVQYKPQNADEICAGARACGNFALWCAHITGMADEIADPLERYHELRALMCSLWDGLRDTEPMVRPLCKLFWDLENPVPGRLERLPHITHDMNTAETFAALAVLDTGRKHFKQHVQDAFAATLKPIGVRNLVFRWARIQYENMHGFQAPPRYSEAQSVADSFGDSDHFAELMDEVLAVADGAPPQRE